MSIKITDSDAKNRILKASGGSICMVGLYTKASEKTLMHCNRCDYDFMGVPGDMWGKRRYGCPKCHNKIKITTSIFKKRVEKAAGKSYIVMSEYSNNSTKVLMKHEKCGRTFLMRPNDFLDGHCRCPRCGNVYHYSTDEMRKKVMEETGKEYSLESEYINVRTKMLIKHNVCGKSWLVTSQNFFQGHRCPYCNISRGEKATYRWLSDNGLIFKQQYRFDDCRNILPLPFDFAVFNKNGSLKFLIEFQGCQHYKEWYFDSVGSHSSIKARSKNDSIKKKYCKSNGIELVEIINRKQFLNDDKLYKLVDKTLRKHLSMLRPNQAI